MTPFDLVEPHTLAEALSLLDPEDHSVRPIAGGTALMLMMKSGVFEPTRLVSLARLDGFSGIAAEPDGSLRIGAMTPLGVMERSPLVAQHAPVIVKAMRRLANVRVRNVACIGGALAHGDPHMDMPPLLASLGAEVVVAGPAGERVIPVQDLYLGYYETVLGKDELIREVRVPALAGRRATYLKCTTRSADDWPALGVALNGHLDQGQLSGVRLVLGAVTEMPARLLDAERVLEEGPLDAARIARACEAAAAAVDPNSDARGSGAYKRQLVRVYVGRAIAAAFQGAAQK
jgi:carbon-monoxide dehydrogenase medium subunit